MQTNELINLAIIAIGAGRIAYSISSEEIFRWLRERVYRYSAPMHDADLDGRPYRLIDFYKTTREERERFPFLGRWSSDWIDNTRKPGMAGMLIECPYCVSAYVTAFGVLAWYTIGDVVVQGAAVFAAWAAASWVGKVLS